MSNSPSSHLIHIPKDRGNMMTAAAKDDTPVMPGKDAAVTIPIRGKPRNVSLLLAPFEILT